MAFGKPGRPREDRLLRQREIFTAVSPLILEIGVRRLTMRMAAYQACLSVGGLYYYFPCKRDLVLHALDPMALSRLCDEFHATNWQLALDHPARYFDVYLNFLTDTALFIRPSVWATIELGGEEMQMGVALGMPMMQEEFLELLEYAVPDTDTRDLPSMVTAIRRAAIGALLDKNVSWAMLRAEFQGLIEGHRKIEPAIAELSHSLADSTGSVSSRRLSR